MKESTLNKYKLVINEWFINGFNGTKAYQSIYPKSSEETAANEFSNIIRIHEIQEYQQEKYTIVQEVAQISHEDITKDLVEIKNRCMQVEPVLDKTGQPTGEYKFDANAAIKAIENLGKHIGYYEAHNKQKDDVIVVNGVSGYTIYDPTDLQ